ncbi:nucleoid occlusion factor SlmA [bacterium M00.F.Ca.ET.228.01.1.1]|uniref:nucleoid occlusion factor SlmA n=1 Tax=Paraburkholderia phenoliruptrix TaxID=252970 RepID=UPI001091D00A|nr:nucleoid occlusion factor SlmA [Paraburkholderia phenoliruptrix]TGP44842.1 nucleoid occlusion factor SlmA [bacterium M00.F.Ca.ET.228.01.1.1]TGS02725.1 nucleoid occlusion factor SlmA [bacterium M00.F.Ca.ET.191.01.1.1]TGU06107.1 nucleoid occlusion factor SlmA [bacterium M00.F.Ca.ET.155.01.1.1]MBW0448030.1 nucleoid occlusion factor SlmA [Paraburkholderia phenoliruptrix]MBW9098075.1 nucleoid occlusion factor SlmA [Paraburkholderia phenoliruptrix]
MQPIDKPDEALAEHAPPHDPALTSPPRAQRPKPGERRVHILQTLAAMLEAPKSEKITTAALAARLGVSEAALYRHFASKAQMFEGLIEFIEQTIFGLINQIVDKENNGVLQARAIALMLLNFSAKNPGMTRVLTCEALVGEHERLTMRVNQMLERVEASLKQCLRVATANANANANADAFAQDAPAPVPAGYDPAVRASLLLSYVIGRWHRFVRSGFVRLPADDADQQLRVILQ